MIENNQIKQQLSNSLINKNFYQNYYYQSKKNTFVVNFKLKI